MSRSIIEQQRMQFRKQSSPILPAFCNPFCSPASDDSSPSEENVRQLDASDVAPSLMMPPSVDSPSADSRICMLTGGGDEGRPAGILPDRF
jgi:hypothetical protein